MDIKKSDWLLRTGHITQSINVLLNCHMSFHSILRLTCNLQALADIVSYYSYLFALNTSYAV